MKITQHFKLEEFEKSETAKRLGIDNSIPAALIPNIKALCENVLEPLRTEINKTTDNRQNWSEKRAEPNLFELCRDDGQFGRSQRTTDSASLTKDSKSPFKGDLEGLPVIISSGYRCPALNKAVGGARNSQHMTGEAADIVIPDKKTGLQWFEWMRTHLTYHQLIWETNSRGGSWIHVSYKQTGKNKMQVLNMRVA